VADAGRCAQEIGSNPKIMTTANTAANHFFIMRNAP
jgi:hypothetical protein